MCHEFTSTNTRKIPEHPWNGKCGFGISENLKISKFSEVLCTWLFDFEISKFEDFEISKFEDSKF